jgi:isopenicillin N synthase-like dioxygenase
VEVRPSGGCWHRVRSQEGFLVLVGDLLARWTNGRAQAARYRLVLPETDASSGRTPDRTVFAYHALPNLDAIVTPWYLASFHS